MDRWILMMVNLVNWWILMMEKLLTILVNKWWIMSSIVTKMNHWAEWKGTTWVADHHLTWRLLHKFIKINDLTSWFIYIHLIWSRFIQGWINDGGGWIPWMFEWSFEWSMLSCIAKRWSSEVVWFDHWDLNPDWRNVFASTQPQKTHDTCHMSILKSWKRVEKQTEKSGLSFTFSKRFPWDFRKLPIAGWRLDQGSHVHGRIHIIEIPFVGWELSIGVHKPQHSAERTEVEVMGKEGSLAKRLWTWWLCLNMLDGLQQAYSIIYIYPLSSTTIHYPLSSIKHQLYHPLSSNPLDMSSTMGWKHPNLSEVRRRNCSCALKDAERVSWILMKSWTWRANLIILIIQWLISNINDWLSWYFNLIIHDHQWSSMRINENQ